MKTAPWIRVAEAISMEFVARHTTVPVPKVYGAWKLDNGDGVILMQWLGGTDTLASRWTTMTSEEKLKVSKQIRGYVDQLRALPQPAESLGRIGPLDGSPCYDERLKGQQCGPFDSEKAFNQFRLSLLDRFRWEKGALEAILGIERKLRDDHRIVFTHGDLGVRNILVDVGGDVVAILDWEMSGWMPEYWEFIKAVHGEWEDEDWLSYARIMTPPYDAEMEVDDQYIIVNGF